MTRRHLLTAIAAIGASWAVSPAVAQGQLNMICAPQIEWCQGLANAFGRETGIQVAVTQKSTGEILAQVRAEAQNPRIDIWFGGTTDPHLIAAEDNLTAPYTSARMTELRPWAIRLHEQVGFKHEARAPCAVRFEGKFYTGITMALLQGPASVA